MKKAYMFPVLSALVHLALFSGADVAARTYSTSFSATENPISEGGNWINGKAVGLDWSDCATTSGFAYGLQPGPSGYDDAVAVLSGTWGPDQTVTAVVRATNQSDALYEEVEIRLRSSLSAHRCTGYEVLWSMRANNNIYVQIVRWNGPIGDWTYVAQKSGSQYRLHDGDEVKATISGNTIRAYINGVQVLQGTDSMFTSGSPGMGFYLQGTTGRNTDYGFKSLIATDGSDQPAPPDNLRVVTNAQASVSIETGIHQLDEGLVETIDIHDPSWAVPLDDSVATNTVFSFSTATAEPEI